MRSAHREPSNPTRIGRHRWPLLAGAILGIALIVGIRPFAAGLDPHDLTEKPIGDVANELIGPGITISNVTFKGDPKAIGVFTGGASAIGFDKGVVLSSGKMIDVKGPNSSGSRTFNYTPPPPNQPVQDGCLDRQKNTLTLGSSGDSGLTSLAGFPTCDAAVLEFDFVPDRDRVFLQYVFGSEEYNEFVNRTVAGQQFNDVFAFWVNGTNCATIDAAHQVPVSIKTINGGGPTLGQSPISHSELFINNDVHPTAPRDTQMDGLTIVLTCQAEVVANQVNHLKLAIADGSDPNQDSDVFLMSGSFTTNPPLKITTKTNGTDNDTGTGPYILATDLVHGPVQWTYLVANNTASDTFTNLVVTDSKGVAVSCPVSVLAPGTSMTCTASGVAAKGQYTNIGHVTGLATILGPVTDSNIDHYFGADPKVSIVTKTNFTNNNATPDPLNPVGPKIRAGTAVNWTYEVTNLGNVPLSDITVTDSETGVSPSCSLTPGGASLTIQVASTLTCLATGVATEGQYTNTGRAVGTPPGGLANVESSDIDHYFGANPRLKLVKTTNGVSGPTILEHDDVLWKYEVTNIGNVTLTDVAVTDDKVTLGPSCTLGSLAAGEIRSCTATALAERGNHPNIGTASGKYGPVIIDGTDATTTVTVNGIDDDFYFGAAPALTIVKKTGATPEDATDNNGLPPPVILVGDPVAWTYTVKNTGNIALKNVSVVDNKIQLGPTCSVESLDVDASYTCSATGLAIRDLQTNIGTATASIQVRAVSELKTVTRQATDDDSYFGAAPEISLVKKTGATIADATDNNNLPAPLFLVGDPVVWTYTVTNTGNVTLNEVAVTDDKLTLGSDCTIGTLAAGATQTCSAAGTAQRDLHTNIGTATGKADVRTVTGPRAITRTATDADAYFGAAPEISILKKTGTTEANAADHTGAAAPVILVGEPVVWTYTVTNTGNVQLEDVRVTDDKIALGPGCTIDALAAGAVQTCSATALAQRDLHTNIGTASGRADVRTVTGLRIVTKTATDDDAYFGAAPELSLIKKTGTTEANAADHNGGAPPVILVGDHVVWTYTVTNTGNVPLTGVGVTDNRITLGAACTMGALAVGASRTCAATGLAQRDLHTNTGIATGTADVLTVTGPRTVPTRATDDDAYFGAAPEISILKKTGTTVANATNNDAAPGAVILIEQEDVHYSFPWNGGSYGSGDNDHDWNDDKDYDHKDYEHKDYGDKKYGDSHYGDKDDDDRHYGYRDDDDKFDWSCSVGYKSFGGGCGSSSHYLFGGHNSSGGYGDYHKKPLLPVVTWVYVVTNTGNVPLTDVAVVDDKVGAICTIGPLAVGASTTCSKTRFAKKGPYENTGTANGTANVLTLNGPRTVVVTDSDIDHYIGAVPDIRIVKKTNGVDYNGKPDTCWHGSHWDQKSYFQSSSCECPYQFSQKPQTKSNMWSDLDRYFGGSNSFMSSWGKGSSTGTFGEPTFVAGSPVMWTYEVTNTGNVTLTNVRVTDSDLSLTVSCPSTVLPPGPDPASTMVCWATGTAIEGHYENTGTARGTVAGPVFALGGKVLNALTVSDQDSDSYVGVKKSKGGYGGHDYDDHGKDNDKNYYDKDDDKGYGDKGKDYKGSSYNSSPAKKGKK